MILDGRMILPQMTGVGRYLLGLAPALAGLATESGLDLEIWLQPGLPADHPARKLAQARLAVRTAPAGHMQVKAQWALPLALHRSQPDLLHYPHFDLPWLAPGPIVATLHDLKYITRPDFFPSQGRAKQMLMLAMFRYTARRARRIITDSEYTRQDLAGRLGTPLEKTCVAPLGVETQYFQPAAPEALAEVRRKYGLETPTLLFVGERRPHKNIDGLLRAFALLRRMHPQPCSLAIAGKPYADYRLPEQLAENLGLGQSVRFIDYVPDADLPRLYQAAQVFVLLSHYEGFGLPALEAMASGTPVVAARRTSLPEVVGTAGLCVEPDEPEPAAQAILQAMGDDAWRAEHIQTGRERAAQFTWQACARRTLAVYQEAAKQ